MTRRDPPVGREAELLAAAAAMDQAAGGRAVAGVVFIGPPGAGKTTVWRAAVDEARAGGWTVLACAPAAQEAALGYAALADLLRDVPPGRIDALPDLQARALRTVLLEEEPDDTVTDRVVAAGLLGLLQLMATEAPMCLALDDIHWMDRSSQRAIGFALRRLVDAPAAVIASQREARHAPPLGQELLRIEGVSGVTLKPMSVASIHHVLRRTVGFAFPRPMLIRITNWSGGNPLLAIELARSVLERGGSVPAGQAAPLRGAAIRSLLGDRVESLSLEERRSLLVAALVERGSLSQIQAAHDRLGWRLALPDASSGLVETTGGTVVFAHPLHAEAAIASAAAVDRASVHRVLAEVTERVDVRARHLAAASAEPDEEVAMALDAAALTARDAGATAEAMELAELAVTRSPTDSPRHLERTLRYADLLYRAGDSMASGRVLEAALASVSSPPARLPVLLRLARVASANQPSSRVVELCREAIRLGRDDPEAMAEAHLLWADIADIPQDGLRHARAALRLIGPSGASRLRSWAANDIALLTMVHGRRVDLRPIRAAAELEKARPAQDLLAGARLTHAFLLLMADRLDEAREELSALHRLAEVSGDEASLPGLLAHLGHLEIRAGNWSRAAEVSAQQVAIAERSGQPFTGALGHAQLGLLGALRGDREAADRHLTAASRLGTDLEHSFARAISHIGRGMLALGEERYAEAADALGESRRELAGRIVDPGMTPWHGQDVEVAARAGRLEEARALADELERLARRTGRTKARAVVDRGRAVLAAAEGDLESALTLARRSLRTLSGYSVPFEQARTLLVLGSIHRRRREKRAADTALAEALARFTTLGAAPWARQAAAERGRIGLRPRAPSTLTNTEALVARLAADGRSNREVAQAAFMSPKTVEANLARAYRKLGVRNRAELGRVMGGGGVPEGAAAPN